MAPTLTDTERAYLDAATTGDTTRAAELAALIDTHQAEQEQRLAAPGALHAAAHWYADHGVPIFACIAGGKRPATRHGFHDATVDHDQIARWWTERPTYNIATPTGHTFDVIDVDGPAGTIALGDFKDAGAMPEVLAWSKTPHGFHYLVPVTGAGNRAAMLPSVDYRGTGGYVVLPPSTTPDGHYRWVPGHELRPEACG